MRPLNPRINDPIKVFGITMREAMYMAGSLLMLIMVLGFLNVYFDVMSIYVFLFILILYTFMFFVLKRANKSDHPDFLNSMISFRFFQPKSIRHYHPLPGRKTLV